MSKSHFEKKMLTDWSSESSIIFCWEFIGRRLRSTYEQNANMF